jgi:hypothetical protein
MLLIALSLPDGFRQPYDRAPDWYGVSFDSAEEGLKEGSGPHFVIVSAPACHAVR